MTGSPAVRSARPGDRKAVAGLLAEAFLDGDLAPWLIASRAERARVYPGYFELLMEHAFEHGLVETTGDGSAAAVWYVHDGREIPSPADYDTRLAELTRPHTARFVALDDAMLRHHPHGRDHHYLAFLAVHPARQGHGHGTRLLRHHHAALDRAGTPAYLEATGPRNGALYARHGYAPGAAFPVGGDGPPLFPMWRDPVRV